MAYEIYLYTTFNSKQKFSEEQMQTIMKISVRYNSLRDMYTNKPTGKIKY